MKIFLLFYTFAPLLTIIYKNYKTDNLEHISGVNILILASICRYMIMTATPETDINNRQLIFRISLPRFISELETRWRAGLWSCLTKVCYIQWSR